MFVIVCTPLAGLPCLGAWLFAPAAQARRHTKRHVKRQQPRPCRGLRGPRPHHARAPVIYVPLETPLSQHNPPATPATPAKVAQTRHPAPRSPRPLPRPALHTRRYGLPRKTRSQNGGTARWPCTTLCAAAATRALSPQVLPRAPRNPTGPARQSCPQPWAPWPCWRCRSRSSSPAGSPPPAVPRPRCCSRRCRPPTFRALPRSSPPPSSS